MLTLLLTAALASTPPAPEEASAPTPETSQAPTVVTLLDAGHGGRRRLRLRSRAGDRWSMQVRRGAETEIALDGAEAERQPSPSTLVELEVETGDDQVWVYVRDGDIDAAIDARSAMHMAIRDLRDVPLSTPVDAQQRHPVVPATLPEDLTPLTAEILSDLVWALAVSTVPFPEAPIGRNARWAWDRSGEEQGVAVTQHLEATLRARRGRHVVIGLTYDVGTPPDTELDGAQVRSLSGTGTGTVWLDRRRPLASGAEVAFTGSLDVAWTDAEGQHELQGRFDAALELATRELVTSP